jgi:Peptidase family M28
VHGEAALGTVRALAGDIGPRGTGTPAEAAARDLVAGRLAALGLAVERQAFRTVTSQNAFPLAIDALALVAVVVYAIGTPLARWAGAALALATAPLLWHTIRTSGRLLQPLLPRVASGNVLARIAPRGPLRRRAVVLAHLDTNRCRLAWQAGAVRHLEPLAWLTLGVLASLGLLSLAGAVLGGPRWVAWASVPLVAYVAGMVVTLVRDDRTPYSPGALDNAGSVAVALELAARLAGRPLGTTEVWVVFTGAEETDHAGLCALLREHRSELRAADFLGLEGLGGGDLVYLVRQGLCARYEPDPRLAALAARVAERHPHLGVHAARVTMEDEVGTLRRSGYRALCIAGIDPAAMTLAHWHRPEDTPDKVSAVVLERAVAYLAAFLESLDAEPASD